MTKKEFIVKNVTSKKPDCTCCGKPMRSRYFIGGISQGFHADCTRTPKKKQKKTNNNMFFRIASNKNPTRIPGHRLSGFSS